uniref:Uncharacterized protein n=1 Tax=Alexandrium monilatum TaxID=311494 RepID=A0A6T1M5W8_9DINO
MEASHREDARDPGSSPASSLSDNSKVSSSPSAVEHRRPERQVNPMVVRVRSEEPDLASRLALAEAVLRKHSGPSSQADSEERDSLHMAQQIEEELERRSNAGSLASSDAATSKDQGGSSNGTERPEDDGREGLEERRRQSIRELVSNYSSDHSKSGSGSSLSRGDKLFGEEDPRSSSSSSNAAKHQTNMELWELLLSQQAEKSKAEVNIVELRQKMADMAEKHGMEMESMQKQLRKTLKREMGKAEEKAHMSTQVAAIEVKHNERTEELKAMAKALSEVKRQFQDEKGELVDWIAGQEARANTKIKNLKSEYNAKLEEEKREQEETEKGKDEMKMELAAHNAVLEKELVTVKVVSKNVAAERDVLRRNMQSIQATHQQHVNCLKEQLEAANMELQKVAKSKLASDSSSPAVVAEASTLTKVVDLREQLVQQRETHREMSDELSELRVQMLGMKQSSEIQEAARTDSSAPRDTAQRSQVGDLQMLLEAADVELAELNIEGVPRNAASLKLPQRARFGGPRTVGKSRGRGGGPIRLHAIDEDDMSSMDGSAAASGNVSSDGGVEVGDLHDFDENIGVSHLIDQGPTSQVVKQVVQQKLEMKSRIEELKEKLAEDHIAVDEVKEELAEKEARHASKVARLMDVVESTNMSRAKALEEVTEMKEALQVRDAEYRAEVKEMRDMLSSSEERYEALMKEQQEKASAPAAPPTCEAREPEHDHVREDLWQQLCGALEAKRIAEGRVEEFKRAMASMERQHSDTVAEMRQQLLVASGSSRGGPGGADAGAAAAAEELEDLRQQLRGSVEERNVLANSLEWKEVQWKSKVENMEMNHAAATSDLERRRGAEVKELTLRLEGELAEARQRLEDSQKERSKLEEKVREPVAPPSAPSWISRLRCPTRGLPGASSSNIDAAAYCQDVCWRILNMIQGTTALLCSINDYKILQATRTACMTWGSAALHGQSVLTLVNGPSRAAWLRKAFQMHQSIADTASEGVPGFVVRDLGCEEFTSKGGQAFDSSVITAHLPAEPACNKEAALLVIIEPQSNQRGAPSAPAAPVPQPVGRVDPRGGGNQSSAHSEVSTVDPSDSASNIFDRNMGMFSRG